MDNTSIQSLSESNKLEGLGENWDEEVEVYLQNISNKCINFRDIHEESAKLYENRFNFFSLILIFVAFLNTALEIVPFENPIYKYCVTVLSLFISTLATINKFLKYQEYATKHRIGSQKFLELNQNISEEFLQDEKFRINGIKYIKWVGKNFVNIRKTLPFPPQNILDKLNLNSTAANPTVKLEGQGGVKYQGNPNVKIEISSPLPSPPLPLSTVVEGQEEEEGIGSGSGSGSGSHVQSPNQNAIKNYNLMRKERFKQQITEFNT